ncbi:MAG: hypothetical protein EOO69_01520 [Moraxellaceae bacterium]|nr:MAG: hypothetical protein EOO69_01520 [Moraxellaceae bacterium]
MASQIKAGEKRKLIAALVSEMAQTIRDHQSLQQVVELLEKQVELAQKQPFTNLSRSQAKELLEQLQSKVMPQLCTSLCAQSPWFGSTEKRLTGLGAASLYMPATASSLAQKHQPFTVQQQLQRVGQHTELLREQLQRKIDRLTGVRAKQDEWETTFPEDE